MVHEQAPAGDDEPGGVHVELGEAVGGFGDERAVVAGMPGDATQALEGLHEVKLPAVHRLADPSVWPAPSIPGSLPPPPSVARYEPGYPVR